MLLCDGRALTAPQICGWNGHVSEPHNTRCVGVRDHIPCRDRQVAGGAYEANRYAHVSSPVMLHFLQEALYDEVLDIGAAHEEAVAAAEVDGALLGVDDAAVADDADEDVEVLRGLDNGRHEVDVFCKDAGVVLAHGGRGGEGLCAELEDGGVVRAEEVDFVRREL